MNIGKEGRTPQELEHSISQALAGDAEILDSSARGSGLKSQFSRRRHVGDLLLVMPQCQEPPWRLALLACVRIPSGAWMHNSA